MKILLFGASGSGTTTLGAALGKRANFQHLDADAYYWKKTEPPFQEKIPLKERNERLKIDFYQFQNVIVSGSLVSWGKEWESAFDLAFFMRLENNERMKRLKKREIERHGPLLGSDKKVQKISKAFLEWANQYENPNFEGRSLHLHLDWMQALDCRVIPLDGSMELEDKVALVLETITSFNKVVSGATPNPKKDARN